VHLRCLQYFPGSSQSKAPTFVFAYFAARRDIQCSFCETTMSQSRTLKGASWFGFKPGTVCSVVAKPVRGLNLDRESFSASEHGILYNYNGSGRV
jgi:hypothetical protein